MQNYSFVSVSALYYYVQEQFVNAILIKSEINMHLPYVRNLHLSYIFEKLCGILRPRYESVGVFSCSELSVLDGLYYLDHISSTSGYMTLSTRFFQLPIYELVICVLFSHLCVLRDLMDAIIDVRLLKMLSSGAQYANKESYGIHITSYIVLSVSYGLTLGKIR